MPFVRFARDKRGYEYVFLVDNGRGRSGPPRLLYWYRTPPGVKIGREPFDAEVRRALEERYREISFDWAAITAAQPPSAEGEMWRERRKAKREARAASAVRAPEPSSSSTDVDAPPEDDPDTGPDSPAADAADDLESIAAELDEGMAEELPAGLAAETAGKDEVSGTGMEPEIEQSVDGEHGGDHDLPEEESGGGTG